MVKKSKSNFLSWLVIVLILVVILGTAYWYYMRFVQPKGLTTLVPSPSNTVQPSPMPSASTSIPADWKTFSNNTFAYSLKYPPAFYLVNGVYDAQNNKVINQDQYVFIDKKAIDSKSFPADTETPPLYFAIFATTSESRNLMSDETGATKTQITFAGETAVRTLLTEPSELDGSYSGNIRFNHNGKGYTITWTNADRKGTHDEEIDLMLASFQFTH